MDVRDAAAPPHRMAAASLSPLQGGEGPINVLFRDYNSEQRARIACIVMHRLPIVHIWHLGNGMFFARCDPRVCVTQRDSSRDPVAGKLEQISEVSLKS